MENKEDLSKLVKKSTDLILKQMDVINKINSYLAKIAVLNKSKEKIETEIKIVSAKIKNFNNN